MTEMSTWVGGPEHWRVAVPCIRCWRSAVHATPRHATYGLGSSLDMVADHAPDARLREAFSKECDQERETLTEVTKWLENTGAPR